MTEDIGISEKILELIRKSHFETVDDLINTAQGELNIPKDVLLKKIIQLEKNGKINLTIPRDSFNTYLFSIRAYWFWMIIVLSVTTNILTFTISERAFPYIFLRYILGSIFVLFLPGYSMMKALFPDREIDNVERAFISIGMSIVLVPLVGLILYYSPWALNLTSETFSLLSLTIILSIVGLIRESKGRTEKTWRYYFGEKTRSM